MSVDLILDPAKIREQLGYLFAIDPALVEIDRVNEETCSVEFLVRDVPLWAKLTSVGTVVSIHPFSL